MISVVQFLSLIKISRKAKWQHCVQFKYSLEVWDE